MTCEIRQATRQDTREIIKRLKSEVKDGEGFWCNRELIRKGAEKGDVSALFADGRLAAFLLHTDLSMDIMEVWPEFQGRGFGRTLAQHGMDRVYRAGRLGITIQCAPETSIPFWRRMGFLPMADSPYCVDYWYVQQQSFDLPTCAARRRVRVDLFTGNTQDKPKTFVRSAAVASGVLHLEKRIAWYDDIDVLAKGWIDDVEVHCTKAKYQESGALGIEFEDGFLRIDRLNIKE